MADGQGLAQRLPTRRVTGPAQCRGQVGRRAAVFPVRPGNRRGRCGLGECRDVGGPGDQADDALCHRDGLRHPDRVRPVEGGHREALCPGTGPVAPRPVDRGTGRPGSRATALPGRLDVRRWLERSLAAQIYLEHGDLATAHQLLRQADDRPADSMEAALAGHVRAQFALAHGDGAAALDLATTAGRRLHEFYGVDHPGLLP